LKTKGSKLILFAIFFVTIALGGTAAFIGYRLSQEEEVTPIEPEAADEDECNSGRDCDLDCVWPKVNYCSCGTLPTPGDEKCKCVNCDAQDGYDGCSIFGFCEGSDPNCQPPQCPDDWEDCGTRVDCGGICNAPGCTDRDESGNEFGTADCRAKGCSNRYIDVRYCKPKSEEQTLTCAGLTSAMGNTITLQKGAGLTQTFTGTTGGTITSDITYIFGIESSNYGTINPSTITGEDTSADTSWSITEAQSNSLQTGTYDNFIWVTMSAQGITTDRSEVCSLDLVVTEEEILVCGDVCTQDSDCSDGTICRNAGAGLICVGDDYQECDLQTHLVNNCSCPQEEAVCGDTCTQDSDCTDGTICRNAGSGLMCVGDDYQECDLQIHLANDCSCPEEVDYNITVDCLSISDTTIEEGQTVTITTRSVLDTETTDSRFIEAVYMGYQPQSCSVSTQGQAGCSVFEQSFANIIAMSSHPFYGNTHEGIVRILDKNPNNITSCTQSGSPNCQIWSGDFAMNSNINKPNLSSTMTLVSIEGEDISGSGQTVYTAKWNLRIDDIDSNLVEESPLKNFILAKAEIDGNEFYSTGVNPFYVYDDDCNFTLVTKDTPDTGIFDYAFTNILISFITILVGFLLFRYSQNLSSLYQPLTKNDKFEKKVLKKLEK